MYLVAVAFRVVPSSRLYTILPDFPELLNAPSLFFSEKKQFFTVAVRFWPAQTENEETKNRDAADDEVSPVGTGEARDGDERDFERFRNVEKSCENERRGVNEEHMEDVKAETRSRQERRKTRRTVGVTL